MFSQFYPPGTALMSDRLTLLRPDDWHRIWPELMLTDGAPEIHAPAETD